MRQCGHESIEECHVRPLRSYAGSADFYLRAIPSQSSSQALFYESELADRAEKYLAEDLTSKRDRGECGSLGCRDLLEVAEGYLPTGFVQSAPSKFGDDLVGDPTIGYSIPVRRLRGATLLNRHPIGPRRRPAWASQRGREFGWGTPPGVN